MRVSQVAQWYRISLAMQKTQVRSLGQEDLLQKEMAVSSSILAWKIPWTEEPDRLHTVHEIAKSQTWLSDWAHIHKHVSILSRAPLPSRLPYSIEQSALCWAEDPSWLSTLITAVSTCQCQGQNIWTSGKSNSFQTDCSRGRKWERWGCC